MKQTVVNALTALGRAFLVAAIATYIATGVSVFELDVPTLKNIAAAGITAALLVAYRALNPNDTAFGVGAPKAGDFTD